MAALTVRSLSAEVHQAHRVRAAVHGRSAEAEKARPCPLAEQKARQDSARWRSIYKVNTPARLTGMDIRYELDGLSFVWDARKAAANPLRHEGITFEQAATVFFDPLFRLVDASRNNEVRDAVIGYDATGRLLFVVHVELNNEAIRLISARRATNDERRTHEHS